MTLTDWMRKHYDLVQGYFISDALMLAQEDGVRVRHEVQISNAFNAETVRREKLRAKFKQRSKVAA